MRWRVAPHVGFYALLAVHRPPVICDVGSFDGQQALRFKRICPSATVIAFEANPASFARIRQNEAIGRAGVVVEHLAASDKAGRVAFNVVEDEPWQSSLLDRIEDDAVTTSTVDAVRLDEYLARAGGGVALWIDVEGAADQVLDGASGLRDRILAVHVELERRGYIWSERPNVDAVLRCLLGWGFQPIGSAPVQRRGAQYDYLLIRSDLLGQLRTRAALLAAAVDTLSRRWLPNRSWPVRLLVVAALALLLRRLTTSRSESLELA